MGLKNSKIAKAYRFIKYCKCRKLCAHALVLSAYYRMKIFFVKPAKLHKKWGVRGEETGWKEPKEVYNYAYWVSYAVDKVCSRTAWESKCLVRALCARHLLKKRGIGSTLYLGCKNENGKILAHAWLRCGGMFVTGGTGEEYATVDQYATYGKAQHNLSKNMEEMNESEKGEAVMSKTLAESEGTVKNDEAAKGEADSTISTEGKKED